MPDYALMAEQIRSLAESEPLWLPVLANASALLNEALPDLNWVGFYLRDPRDGSLVLGPFQGKAACIRIAEGRGVCGAAALKDEVQLVPDVHKFPGHIACDSASNSEIVVPVHSAAGGGEAGRPAIVAVLDIDSPLYDRFSAEDRDGLTAIVRVIEECADFSGWYSL